MVWSLENRQLNGQKSAQTTMGLLFLQLLTYTDRIEQGKADRYASRLAMAALRYIEVNYKEASLTELARRENQSVYELSRLIKAQTGFTFKELLQLKRFNKAASLLAETRLPVTDIIEAVGYDNTSYFYRRFHKNMAHEPQEIPGGAQRGQPSP
ncbi:MAG: helix-turn-helix domain-containing protein [Hydrogeniiclostridium mannosilyticum]